MTSVVTLLTQQRGNSMKPCVLCAISFLLPCAYLLLYICDISCDFTKCISNDLLNHHSTVCEDDFGFAYVSEYI